MPPAPSHARRRPDFHDLMQFRIWDVLLVARPYDSFILEEAGQLAERMLGEFRNLDVHYAPGLTNVATGAEAIALARRQSRFNLVISALQLQDMNGAELARRIRAEGLDVPVVLLAFDNRELKDFVARAAHRRGGLENRGGPCVWWCLHGARVRGMSSIFNIIGCSAALLCHFAGNPIAHPKLRGLHHLLLNTLRGMNRTIPLQNPRHAEGHCYTFTIADDLPDDSLSSSTIVLFEDGKSLPRWHCRNGKTIAAEGLAPGPRA